MTTKQWLRSFPNSEFRIPNSLQPCLTTDKLLTDAQWEIIVRELMLEVIATANALGHAIPSSLADKQIERTCSMGAYKASTLVDFELGRPLELQAIFLEPLRQAKKTRVPVPQLERLCSVLKALDSKRSAR